jgi:hypothetical protein
VWKSIKYHGPPPPALIRWTLAERFGWTLEYIDSLPIPDLFEFFAIEEGREKARPAPTPQKGRKR